MNVIDGFMPAQSFSVLDGYVQDACNYDSIKKLVLVGELKQLPQQDRLFLLAFMTRREILHEAVRQNDELFVKMLVEVGMDINARDTGGQSVFAYANKSELFEWLLQQGAQFEHPSHKSMLKYVISLITLPMNYESWEWVNILPDTMKLSTLDEFCALSYDEINLMLDLAKSRPAIAAILKQRALEITEQKPQGVLKIAETMLVDHGRKKLMKDFLYLINNGLIKDPYIEQIVTNAGILFWNIDDKDFFRGLIACWRPSGDLLALAELCNDFRLGIFCHAILRTAKLKDASRLYSQLEYFPKAMVSLDKEVKKRLVEHVEALQKKEGTTIWHAMAKQAFVSKDLLQMTDIGFDPNWTESTYNRNFLFTKKAWCIECDEYKRMQFNLHHVDSNGDNALDHHCRHSFKAGDCILTLSKAGLKLSDHFPNIEECRKAFPKNSYLQAILAAGLLNPQKHILKDLFQGIPDKETSTFFAVITKDPGLRKILKRKDEVQGQLNAKREKGQWRGKFHLSDLKKMEELINDKSEREYSVMVLASFWKECIPSEELNLIPESPSASLVIGAIKKQHQNLVPGIEPIPVHELFNTGLLSHDDMVFFNRYIFEHPELMNQLVQKYMKVQEIAIQAGGGSISKHAEFVAHLISGLGDVLHLRKSFDLPQENLIQAFNQIVLPAVKETLNIAEDARVRWLGRTAVVCGKEGCEAFKFLKKGEKYDYFAQEHSVSMAFNQLAGQFKSQFIKPIGVYAVKQLPPALADYKRQLAEDQPAIVYHYKALPETFEYLQDLSPEKYAAARSCSLHDAAKMIHMGIYPDLAAMFHNDQQDRRYILLVDLMVCLTHQSQYSLFMPAGGAGRLEQPFAKTLFPNMRASGLTDLRDASLLNGWKNSLSYRVRNMRDLGDINKNTTRYFYQMHALSNVLLVDMLIQSQRYINYGCLQWQNDALMQQFANELAEGFAHVTASYSEQPYEKSLHFALQCGINWIRASRQIAFWLDNGPNGYPAWVVQGKLPGGLYEDGVVVTVDVSKAKNFDRARGFSSNGHQDIGAYNGPLALTEFEKAMYLLFNAVALAEPLQPPPPPKLNSCNDWEWSTWETT
jgi:hypothetical protein